MTTGECEIMGHPVKKMRYAGDGTHPCPECGIVQNEIWQGDDFLGYQCPECGYGGEP